MVVVPATGVKRVILGAHLAQFHVDLQSAKGSVWWSNDMFQAESMLTVSVPDACSHIRGSTGDTLYVRERSRIGSVWREHSDWSV